MNPKFSMSIVVGLSLAGVLAIGGCMTVSYGNDFARMEARIEAQYKQDQNNYANYFSTIKEMAQVPEMYTEDLKKVYSEVMKGRYGADGSHAMFQFIKEHNPDVSPAVYTKIQTAIQSGRANFSADQKVLLDMKNTYEQMTMTQPGHFFAWVNGYPKKDLASMDIVINAETEEAFRTKRAAPIKIR